MIKSKEGNFLMRDYQSVISDNKKKGKDKAKKRQVHKEEMFMKKEELEKKSN